MKNLYNAPGYSHQVNANQIYRAPLGFVYTNPTLETRANVYQRNIAQNVNHRQPHMQLADVALTNNAYGGKYGFDALRHKGLNQGMTKVTTPVFYDKHAAQQPVSKVQPGNCLKRQNKHNFKGNSQPLRVIPQVVLKVEKYHKLKINIEELDNLVAEKIATLKDAKINKMVYVNNEYSLLLLSDTLTVAYSQIPKDETKIRLYFYYFIASFVDVLVQVVNEKKITASTDFVPKLNKTAFENMFEYMRAYVWAHDQYCWRNHLNNYLCQEHSVVLDKVISSFLSMTTYNKVNIKYARKTVLSDPFNQSLDKLWKLIDYRLGNNFSRRSKKDITMTYNYQHIITVMENMKIVLSSVDKKMLNYLEKIYDELEKYINQTHLVKYLIGSEAQYFFTQSIHQAQNSINFCLYMSRKLQTHNVSKGKESTEINNIIAALQSLKGNFSRPPNAQAQVEWEYDPKHFNSKEKTIESHPLRVKGNDFKQKQTEFYRKWIKDQALLFINQLESQNNLKNFKTIQILIQYLEHIVNFTINYKGYILNIEHFKKFFNMVQMLNDGMTINSFEYDEKTSTYLTWVPSKYVSFFWSIRNLNIEFIKKYKSYFTTESSELKQALASFDKLEKHKQTLPLFKGLFYECTEVVMFKHIFVGYDFDVRLNKFVVKRKTQKEGNVNLHIDMNRPETRAIATQKRSFFFYLQYERIIEQIELLMKNQAALIKKMDLADDLPEQLRVLGLGVHLTKFTHKLNDYDYLFIKLSDMRPILTEIVSLRKAVIEATKNQYDNSESLETLEDLLDSILLYSTGLFFYDNRFYVFKEKEHVSFMYKDCYFDEQLKSFMCKKYVNIYGNLRILVAQMFAKFDREYNFLDQIPIYIHSKLFVQNANKLLAKKDVPADLTLTLNDLFKDFNLFWQNAKVLRDSTDPKNPIQFLSFDPQDIQTLNDKVTEFLDNSLPVDESQYPEELADDEISIKKALSELLVLLQTIDENGSLFENLSQEEIAKLNNESLVDLDPFSEEANNLPENDEEEEEESSSNNAEVKYDIKDDKRAIYNKKNVDDEGELDSSSSSTDKKKRYDIKDDKRIIYNKKNIDDEGEFDSSSSSNKKDELDVEDQLSYIDTENLEDEEFYDDISSDQDFNNKKIIDSKIGEINPLETEEIDSHSFSSSSDHKGQKMIQDNKVVNYNKKDINEEELSSENSSTSKKSTKSEFKEEIVQGPKKLDKIEHTIPQMSFDDESPIKNTDESPSKRDQLLKDLKDQLLIQVKNGVLPDQKRPNKLDNIVKDIKEEEESSSKNNPALGGHNTSFVSELDEEEQMTLDQKLAKQHPIEKSDDPAKKKLDDKIGTPSLDNLLIDEKKQDLINDQEEDSPLGEKKRSKEIDPNFKLNNKLQEDEEESSESDKLNNSLSKDTEQEELLDDIKKIPNIQDKTPEQLAKIEATLDSKIDNSEIPTKEGKVTKLKNALRKAFQKMILDRLNKNKKNKEHPLIGGDGHDLWNDELKKQHELEENIKKDLINKLIEDPKMKDASPQKLHEFEDRVDQQIDNKEIIPHNVSPSKLKDLIHDEIEDIITKKTDLSKEEEIDSPLKKTKPSLIAQAIKSIGVKNLQDDPSQKKSSFVSELEEDSVLNKMVTSQISEEDLEENEKDKNRTIEKHLLKDLEEKLVDIDDKKTNSILEDEEISETLNNSKLMNNKTPEELVDIKDQLKKDINNGSLGDLKVSKHLSEVVENSMNKLIEMDISKKNLLLNQDHLDLVNDDLSKKNSEEDPDFNVEVLNMEDEEESTSPQKGNSTPQKQNEVELLDVPHYDLSPKSANKKKDEKEKLDRIDAIQADVLDTEVQQRPRKIRRVIIIEEMKCTLCVNDQLLTYFVSQLK